MYYGLLALLTRSLRQDARQLRNHLFRLAFVAFIYIFLLWATVTAGSLGAPGLTFFKLIAWLNAIFISCAGIGFFASAITEEKEEETIGLLTMAGLNPLAILLGKSTSRLIQAAMLLIVQFPFMLLAVTLGGVTPHQIIAAYVALLAFMTLVANVALVWSTVCERGGSAAGLTCLLLVLYTALPLAAPSIRTELATYRVTPTTHPSVYYVIDLIADSCVFLRLSEVMRTGFKDPIVSRQVISNIAAGAFCFAVAWVIFIPCTRNSASGGVSRGMVVKPTSRVRILGAGRTWAMPLVWKDFHFIAGGYTFAFVKMVLYLALLLSLVSLEYAGMFGGWLAVREAYVMCLMAAVVIESSIMAARIYHDEVRLQTLSSLMMLPRSIGYLAYTKALGCFLGLVPSIVCLTLGAVVIHDVGLENALIMLIRPQVWGVILVLMIFLHLVALLSLFVKWGALPLAIVLMVPMSGCCPLYAILFMVVSPGGVRESAGELAATITIWILMTLSCFVFQMMIASRLQEIGSK